MINKNGISAAVRAWLPKCASELLAGKKLGDILAERKGRPLTGTALLRECQKTKASLSALPEEQAAARMVRQKILDETRSGSLSLAGTAEKLVDRLYALFLGLRAELAGTIDPNEEDPETIVNALGQGLKEAKAKIAALQESLDIEVEARLSMEQELSWEQKRRTDTEMELEKTGGMTDMLQDPLFDRLQATLQQLHSTKKNELDFFLTSALEALPPKSKAYFAYQLGRLAVTEESLVVARKGHNIGELEKLISIIQKRIEELDRLGDIGADCEVDFETEAVATTEAEDVVELEPEEVV